MVNISLVKLDEHKFILINDFIVVTILIICLVNSTVVNIRQSAFGSENKFDQSDFIIKNFGIGVDGNPFLAVEGRAGGTIAEGENMAYLYAFETDNGTYGIMSDSGYTKWHSHGITLDEKNCILSSNNKGGADVNDVIELTKTNATDVHQVFTAEYAISNSDGSICPTKIFDTAP